MSRKVNTTVDKNASETSEETKKLIHELEVHQVELESQNEQLKHTQEELEALHSKYFDLYNLLLCYMDNLI